MTVLKQKTMGNNNIVLTMDMKIHVTKRKAVTWKGSHERRNRRSGNNTWWDRFVIGLPPTTPVLLLHIVVTTQKAL